MKTVTFYLAPVALLALVLVSSGCGSDGGDTAGNPTAAPTATLRPIEAATHTPSPTATTRLLTPTAPPPTATPTASGQLDIAVCAPNAGPFSANINHPFLPLTVGTHWAFFGAVDGSPTRLVITALDETEVVAGVTTRVVEEREWQDEALVEVARNFFVQAADGTVCYYGEDVDEYQAGQIVGHDSQWRAGVDGALPGILLPAEPQLGQRFQQEVAIGVAEDRAELVAVGETVTVDFGTFTDTIRFEESTPLDSGTSVKIYARGAGLLVDDELERLSMSACGTLDGAGCAPQNARVDLAEPSFSNPTQVTNPLFPVSQQHSVVNLGTVGGESFRAEVTLLPSTRTIEVNGQAVQALQSQYAAFVDGRIEEVALDSYAQADDGAVWYLGEDVFNYQEGELADTGGTWLAGRDGPPAMIMPASPEVGDVFRSENIPGLVFEEITVENVGAAVDGPYGRVSGAIRVRELHTDGGLEEKTFAPGYGEFLTSGGGDVEALALAVPTDALGTPLPNQLATLATGANAVFDAAEKRDWDAASTTLDGMMAAWASYRAGGVSPRLEAQMSDALASLEDEVDAENAAEVQQAAIEVGRATLDFHLRHRPVAEVDRARFVLWARQALVDAAAEDQGALRGDVVTLAWVRDRFAHTLAAADAARLDSLLGELRAAAETPDFGAAAGAAQRLREQAEPPA